MPVHNNQSSDLFMMMAWENEKQDKLKRILNKYSSKVESQLPVYHRPAEITLPRKDHGCSSVLDDFCANSTIHGIKYMGDRKRHWAERVWWLIAFILSIYGCSRLIYNIWQRWDRSPVIVSFAEKSTPIWQIPFPSVTICLETKSQSDLFNYTEMYHTIQGIDSGYQPNNLTQEQ